MAASSHKSAHVVDGVNASVGPLGFDLDFFARRRQHLGLEQDQEQQSDTSMPGVTAPKMYPDGPWTRREEQIEHGAKWEACRDWLMEVSKEEYRAAKKSQAQVSESTEWWKELKAKQMEQLIIHSVTAVQQSINIASMVARRDVDEADVALAIERYFVNANV
jgi:hypothetical protein